MTNWHDIFIYDESSPSRLINKITRHPRAKAGSTAGNQRKDGYWVTRFNGKNYLVHRIVYEIFYGPIPQGLHIDHVDGDCKNNSLINLRAVSPAINNRNMKMDSRNKSGISGVSKIKVNSRGNIFEYWCAYYQEDCKTKLKHFSVLKYGDEIAKELAIKFRADSIKKLNDFGAGYTDRHGENKEKN